MSSRGGRRRHRNRNRNQQRTHVRQYCLAVLAELRAMLGKVPRPVKTPCCHTCAFNPSTDDWPGMEKTVLELLRALDSGIPFVCHEGLPRTAKGWYLPVLPMWNPKTRALSWPAGAEPPLCGGYAAVKDLPGIDGAVTRAFGRLPAGTKSALMSALVRSKGKEVSA